MSYSRRDLSLVLPALATAASAADKPAALPSRTYPFESLTVKVNGQNSSRAVIDGATRAGYHIDMHITELAPGLDVRRHVLAHVGFPVRVSPDLRPMPSDLFAAE